MKDMKKQPRYQQIAMDIAARIARNDFEEGQRISGRSVLSSEYAVSPETIRRAINLLEEENVVEVAPNYGVIVGTKVQALAYLDGNASVNDATALKHKLTSLMDKRHELDVEINNVIQEIMDISSRFASSDPLRRFEYNIDPSSKLVGKSIRSSSFYQITNMTIIAISRQGEMMLSPGPDAVFEAQDVLVVVGHIQDVIKVEMLVQG
ncbi:GntR family transcriptional regulator [Erysipelothrix sp. HDW6B]|uniref:TrkA C-terminal domain-containing protein n=1 Tax=Erysipelothrix TaxID=1647 RepID=UPI001358FD9C|nr:MULTISPECIES: TrkA C-terminal domain-containing protein [Erysipelothrix]QIK85960.1 GntR family transcriptional regulator [Erysipelothrix sp. HDW6B]